MANNGITTTTNSITDPASPFYMHPNENPRMNSVVVKLNGPNYHSWSRAVLMALKSKNKKFFVNDTLFKLKADDPIFKAWDRCNTLVLSWLVGSLEETIAQSIYWLETSYKVWVDLKERFYQGDVFRICDLQEEIYGARQRDMSISAYFSDQKKKLRQELNNFRPIPKCICLTTCSCNLISTITSYRDNDYVIRFLKGLNEKYSGVRSQIMLMDHLPNFNTIFSMLVQQERQFTGGLDETKIFSNSAKNGVCKGVSRNGGRGGAT